MRRGSAIGSFCAASVVVGALLLALHGCQRPADDPPTRLLRQLPSGQALYLYLDLGSIRESSSLAPLLRNGVAWAAGLGDIASTAGLNFPHDVNLAALSLGTKGTNLALQGRFDEASVMEALEAAGAVCSESLRGGPCTLPAAGSGPELSLLLRAQDLLRVTIGASIGDAGGSQIEAELQKLVVLARERLDRGSVLWATFDPARAEQSLAGAPEGLENLRFFARALQRAERGYLYADFLPDGKLQITLKANCADSRQAVSVSNVLTGLNRLAAAALEAGRGDEPPPEVHVLRAARIVNTETTVVAVWVLDESILRAWGGV